MKKRSPRFDKAAEIFKEHGGILRTSEALSAGIHPDTLYAMRDFEVVEVVSRGVFRLADGTLLSNPDLIPIAKRIPEAVICLISALAFHDITTQIPHEVHIALKRGAAEPRLDYPPIKTYRFTGAAFTEGIENHKIDGVSVRTYNLEKTIADCFKFRNRVGLDTAVEAVRLYRERKTVRVDDLMHYAEICRVKKIIRPYLEVLL
jgi:predicted transcriptional regulator of viral defense system